MSVNTKKSVANGKSSPRKESPQLSPLGHSDDIDLAVLDKSIDDFLAHSNVKYDQPILMSQIAKQLKSLRSFMSLHNSIFRNISHKENSIKKLIDNSHSIIPLNFFAFLLIDEASGDMIVSACSDPSLHGVPIPRETGIESKLTNQIYIMICNIILQAIYCFDKKVASFMILSLILVHIINFIKN